MLYGRTHEHNTENTFQRINDGMWETFYFWKTKTDFQKKDGEREKNVYESIDCSCLLTF